MNKLLSVMLLMVVAIGFGCSNENTENVPSENRALENVIPTVTSSVVNAPQKSSVPAPKVDKVTSAKNGEKVMAETPTPVVLLDLPSVEASDVMDKLKNSWVKGYPRNTDLDISLDLTVSGSDLTQSLPLKMKGKVDKYSNFEGTLDSSDSNGLQEVQLITLEDKVYYKFREAVSWSEMQDARALLTPYMIANILINQINDGVYVSSEIMGGVETYHL